MRVVPVPRSLDHRSFDRFIRRAQEGAESKTLFDARRLQWVDPFGMIGLLAAGAVARDREGGRPRLYLPASPEVLGYLSRMRFPQAARSVFVLTGAPRRRLRGESDVLLEITTVSTNSDVHEVVDRVQKRAGAILSRTLDYPPTAVVQFSVVLSELCQNIIEHAEAPGWVAAQAYRWTRRLGRQVVVISVSDLGRGFRGSLAEEHGPRFPDGWSDAAALEAAFLHGVTRFADLGRGQGIQQIRKQVRRWDGAFSIRSGSARIADVPSWDVGPTLERGLPRFPGAQIHIVLPQRMWNDR